MLLKKTRYSATLSSFVQYNLLSIYSIEFDWNLQSLTLLYSRIWQKTARTLEFDQKLRARTLELTKNFGSPAQPPLHWRGSTARGHSRELEPNSSSQQDGIHPPHKQDFPAAQCTRLIIFFYCYYYFFFIDATNTKARWNM